MSDATPTVAVIGTGRMGGAMATPMSGAGFDLIVWNRDETKANEVAARSPGTRVASSAAEAASNADVLITSLADDDDVRTVYLESSGVVEGIESGSIAVETSTVDPETVKEVGKVVDDSGAGFLDCPVSGSVVTVEAGALTIMVGGDQDLLERVRPVLDALATRVVHVGDREAGAATKLAVNGLGDRVGAPMNQAETGLEIVRGAIESGMGQRDLSAIAVYLRGDEA